PVPLVVVRRFLLPPISVTNRALPGPAAMPPGLPAAANLVTVPLGLIRPMLPLTSVNQKAPSGPAVIVNGALAGVGKSVTATIDKSPSVRGLAASRADFISGHPFRRQPFVDTSRHTPLAFAGESFLQRLLPAPASAGARP